MPAPDSGYASIRATNYVTSGGQAHYVGKPLALGRLPIEIAKADERMRS